MTIIDSLSHNKLVTQPHKCEYIINMELVIGLINIWLLYLAYVPG